MIGQKIQQSMNGGPWETLGVIENEQEAREYAAVIKQGSHAIMGGQHTVQYRIKPESYRYRNDRSTHHNRKAFDKIIARLGRIKYVKGYRYNGRYNANHEAVLVRGEKGVARFGGLLWGYGGEGPRGLHELLLKLGVPSKQAWEVAFQTPRLNQLGEDWRLTLAWDFVPGRIKAEEVSPIVP